MYDLLRDEYDIQIEFGDIGNILAYISIGDRIQDIERLVGALEDISHTYRKIPEICIAEILSNRVRYFTPGGVLRREKTDSDSRDSRQHMRRAGYVLSARDTHFTPGERITPEIIEYIFYAKEKGCSIQGTKDPDVEYLKCR